MVPELLILGFLALAIFGLIAAIFSNPLHDRNRTLNNMLLAVEKIEIVDRDFKIPGLAELAQSRRAAVESELDHVRALELAYAQNSAWRSRTSWAAWTSAISGILGLLVTVWAELGPL